MSLEQLLIHDMVTPSSWQCNLFKKRTFSIPSPHESGFMSISRSIRASYLDDILIYSQSEEQYKAHLDWYCLH
jgi:hypothetical protein